MEAKANKFVHPYRKLNKELIDEIVQDISEGATNKHACESRRITESIFYVWIEQGVIDFHEQKDSLCAYLVESLRKVENKEIKQCRKLIRNSRKGHKGAQWTLEHAFWRYFSDKVSDIDFNDRLNKVEQKQNPNRYNNGVLNNGNIEHQEKK